MYFYLMTFMLFVLGLYCLIAKKHLVKKIIGIMLIEFATNLFLVLLGYRENGIPPILLKDMDATVFAQQSVDPLPQAFVITSIVVGMAGLILMVSMSLYLYEKYKTFDTSKINRLKG